MANSISLGASVRSSLISLQDTASLQASTQNHLSTGKKVASALDNPTNFFTASSLNDRSANLTSLLDGISNGIQTIQAASKGLDGITSLVKSLQSTVKQAQSDAASNRPKIASAVDFATATESAATGKSERDTALAKTLVSGGATAATDSSNGSIGLAAAAANNTKAIQLKAGSTTYTFNFSATATVRDLVDGINKSGIANASVGDDGKLVVTGTGSDALTVASGSTLDADGTFTALTADKTALFGATNNAGVTATGSSAIRSNLVKQFNDLRTQIDALAKDSGYNGTNLLAGNKLTITFNEKTGTAQNKLEIQSNEVTSSSLGIGQFVDSATAQTNGNFSVQNDSDLTKAADALTATLASLNSTASTLGSNLAIVQTRQDFTKQLANVLTTGADNLTNADLNFEAANYTALQTRQSIAQQTLSLATQSNQGVLQLLR